MEALEILSKYRDIQLKEERERKLWKRCYEYLNMRRDGEFGQWQTEHRKNLEAQGRPPISFNIMKKFLNRICGSQVASQVDEKAYPRDDDSDPLIAEILTDLLKYVKDINQAELAYARMFRDGIITGRGFIKTEFNTDYDAFGDISIKALSPFRIYIIGDGEEYDISKDRQAIIEEIPMDKEEIKLRWENKSDEIDGLTKDLETEEAVPIAKNYDYGFGLSVPTEYVFDKEDKKLKVLRYQKISRRKLNFLKDSRTNEMIESPKKKEDKQAMIDVATAQGYQLSEATQIVKYVEVTYSVGSVMLEEKESIYKHGEYDITAFFCYNDNGQVTGVMQDLLDPQDEKNKRRSQAIHLLGTAAKNSHWVKKGAVDDINKARTEMGKTGALIEVNGDPRQTTAPIESNTTAIPALLQIDISSDNEMKTISGLNDASLGIVPEGVKSGRGISALQQPTETIVAEIFFHYLNTRKIVTKKVLSMIQQFYTEDRRVRILGDYFSQVVPPQLEDMRKQLQQQIMIANPLMTLEQAILESNRMIDIADGSKTVWINRKVLNTKLNDISVGRYDVIIDHVSANPTTRRQQYQDMLNMKSLGAPISWRAIIEVSDIRNKQKILMEMEQEEQKMMVEQLMMSQKPQKATPPQQNQEHDLMQNSAGVQF